MPMRLDDRGEIRPSTSGRRYDTKFLRSASASRGGIGAGPGGAIRESGLTEALIGKLGYLGIALLLILGGLGLPVPEEAPIILAAVLSKNERMWWPLGLALVPRGGAARRLRRLLPRRTSTARR